jgi:hypothetical protein
LTELAHVAGGSGLGRARKVQPAFNWQSPPVSLTVRDAVYRRTTDRDYSIPDEGERPVEEMIALIVVPALAAAIQFAVMRLLDWLSSPRPAPIPT